MEYKACGTSDNSVLPIPIGDMNRGNRSNWTLYSAVLGASMRNYDNRNTTSQKDIVYNVMSVIDERVKSGSDRYYLYAAVTLVNSVSKYEKINNMTCDSVNIDEKIIEEYSDAVKELLKYSKDKFPKSMNEKWMEDFNTNLSNSEKKAITDLISDPSFIRIVTMVNNTVGFDEKARDRGIMVKIGDLAPEFKEIAAKGFFEYQGSQWVPLLELYRNISLLFVESSCTYFMNKIRASLISDKLPADSNRGKIIPFSAFAWGLFSALKDENGKSVFVFDNEAFKNMIGINRPHEPKWVLSIFGENADTISKTCIKTYVDDDSPVFEDVGFYHEYRSEKLIVCYSVTENPVLISVASNNIANNHDNLPCKYMIDTDPMSQSIVIDNVNAIYEGSWENPPEELLFYDNDQRIKEFRSITHNKIGTIFDNWNTGVVSEALETICNTGRTVSDKEYAKNKKFWDALKEQLDYCKTSTESSTE